MVINYISQFDFLNEFPLRMNKISTIKAIWHSIFWTLNKPKEKKNVFTPALFCFVRKQRICWEAICILPLGCLVLTLRDGKVGQNALFSQGFPHCLELAPGAWGLQSCISASRDWQLQQHRHESSHCHLDKWTHFPDAGRHSRKNCRKSLVNDWKRAAAVNASRRNTKKEKNPIIQSDKQCCACCQTELIKGCLFHWLDLFQAFWQKTRSSSWSWPRYFVPCHIVIVMCESEVKGCVVSERCLQSIQMWKHHT